MSHLQRPSHPKAFYTLMALSGLELYLALMVIAGWYMGSVTLTQVLPQFAPMQYNTALGFVLSSVGLFGLLLRRPVWAGVAGLVLILLSGITLFQYLGNIDTGLDQLFMKVQAQARTSHPGRPSPNTAFCFLLTGIVLAGELIHDKLGRWPQRYWLVGIILCTLAVVTMLGYAVEVPSAYGWGHLMRMALHTAAGFLITGSVLLGYAFLGERLEGKALRQFLTTLVAVLGFVIALFNYQIILFAQEQQIREQKAYQVELIASQTQNFILSRVSAFERLARRREQMQNAELQQGDIQTYFQDMPDLLSAGEFSMSGPLDYQRLEGRTWVLLPEAGLLVSVREKLAAKLSPVQLQWQRPYLWVAVRLGFDTNRAMLFQLDMEKKIRNWQRSGVHVSASSHLIVSGNPQELAQDIEAFSYLDPLMIGESVRVDDFSLQLTFLEEPQLVFRSDKRVVVVFLIGLVMAATLALAMNWFVRNRELQRYLRAVQDASTTGLVGSGMDGRIVFCNKAAQTMFGYTEAQLCDMSIEDLLPPEVRNHHVGLRQLLQTEKVSRKLESRHLLGYDSKGVRFPLDIGIGFTETKDGTVVISSIVDMRQQKQLEADLQWRNTQLSLLLNSVGEGIFGVNADGHCTFINPAACHMLGYEESQLLDSFIHDLIHYKRADGRVCEWDGCAIARAIRNREAINIKEEVFWRRDGSSFYVESIVNPIQVENEVLGAVVVFSDITARREFENLQKQHTEKLQQVNQDLEEFNYVASHDLKEPLRTLKSFCGFLEEDLGGELSDEVAKDLRFINQAAERMQLLINDLLEFSRAGSRSLQSERVDLDAVLARVTENLQAAIADSEAKVHVGRMPPVLGDAKQLERVFQNLVSNAIKFHGDKAPRVNVSATLDEEKGVAVIAVSDNGVGVPLEFQEQIFGAFKRLHSMDEVEGSGIGLAVVKKLVERHNGRIWLSSKEGVGSTFFVELPSFPA